MHRFIGVAFFALLPGAASAVDEAIAKPIAALKAVDREGKNNDTVGLAWSGLVSQGAPALLPTLEAVDDANPTAANWLLTAVGAIAEGETKAKRKLPTEKLVAFVKDAKFAGTARVFAFDMLAEPEKAKLLPGFLNDPSSDLRRVAVQDKLDALAKLKPAPKDELEKLLTAARDADQVEALAKKLEADHKTKVSLTEHFAFITYWHIIGPFESARGKALTLKHAPEKQGIDIEKGLTGKADAKVNWKYTLTRDKYATVDFNKEIGKHYDAAAYAVATLVADKAGPVEIRVGSPNALQVFLNGKKLFEREEYHHGDSMDYHVGKGQLVAGPNELIVKICQNNQKDNWAQRWQFQARVCDATGAPIPGVKQQLAIQDQVQLLKLGSVPPATPATEEKK